MILYMKEVKNKRFFLNLLILFILLALIFCVFHNDYKEILECIKSISLWGLLILLGMEIIYQLLDSAACYILIHSQFSFFKFRQAIGITFLGIFGNVATFSAGIIPLQSYYLYKYGIEVGNSVGMINLKYIFHKLTIFIYAFVTILVNKQWLRSTIPNITKYIYIGFAVCAIILIFLILICTLRSVQLTLLKLIDKLPDTKKWKNRKDVWRSNLKVLYDESKKVVGCKTCCISIIIINILKLFLLYSIPFICIKVLGFSGLTFTETHILSSIMLLIIGVLPNVAGIGPTEFAFLMLFSTFLGKIQAPSALILYRIATYFFPFLLSILVFLKIKNSIINGIDDVNNE